MKFHSIGPVSYDSLVDACRDSEYSVLTVHSGTIIEHNSVMAFLSACDPRMSYSKALAVANFTPRRDNEVTKTAR